MISPNQTIFGYAFSRWLRRRHHRCPGRHNCRRHRRHHRQRHRCLRVFFIIFHPTLPFWLHHCHFCTGCPGVFALRGSFVLGFIPRLTLLLVLLPVSGSTCTARFIRLPPCPIKTAFPNIFEKNFESRMRNTRINWRMS